MISNFYSYKVKVRNKPFVTSGGRQFENTAAVAFYDDKQKEIAYLELGYVDPEDVYRQMDEGLDINIDQCYVENFSLSSYRQSRGKAKDEPVKIHSFSACESFFDARVITDFSFCHFLHGPVNFHQAFFLNGEVSFSNCSFGTCDVDFSYAIFKNGNVDFSKAFFEGGNLSFKNTIFGQGAKNFQYTRFGKGEKNFTNAEFGEGDSIFINADFNDGDVSFKIARFGKGNIDFRFSRFGEGNINFERTDFSEGKVDFSKVDFSRGKVSYNRAVFGSGEINFEGASLKEGKISFMNTVFGDGDLNFEYLEFDRADAILDKARYGNGKISFYGSKLHSLSMKNSVLNNYTDLRVAKCDSIDLSGTVVRDLVDIKPQDFPVEVQQIYFTGMCLLGRIYIDWVRNRVEKIILSQPHTSCREKSEQFRILKQNFNVNGNYEEEDKAYVLFKRYEAKANLQDSLKEASWIQKGIVYLSYFIRWLFYDKMGKYATDPLRVLTSVFYTYLFFSLLHYLLPFIFGPECYNFPSAEHPMNELTRLGVTLYYSAITFFTVGYGEFLPLHGLSRALAGIEAFFGVFMMSYFTVAFARKILR